MSSFFKNAYEITFDAIFTYSTVRQAKIHSVKIALIFRIIQLSILAYIIGWSIVYKKGYQEIDKVSSSVSTKVKGLGYVNYGKNMTNSLKNNLVLNEDGDQIRIFDTADYIIPPAEYNSIFVMTNFVETQQTHGLCDENYLKNDCLCKTDNDCVNRVEPTNSWNGIPTGKCVTSSINSSVTVCQIASWCPVENEIKDGRNLIQNVGNYTIFIKNDVKFELFNKRERNLLENITNEYIASCTYEPIRDPFCPVFTIEEIMKLAESDPEERDKMFQSGGLIRIRIDWNCNYDYFSHACLPRYKFDRFDVPYKDNSSASGYNFRFADKYEINGTMYRELTKAYGLRFIIIVTGQAGKFNFLPLLLTLGSGLGLLSLATVAADLVMLNLLRRREFYKGLKELNYKDEESTVLENSTKYGTRSGLLTGN